MVIWRYIDNKSGDFKGRSESVAVISCAALKLKIKLTTTTDVMRN